MKTRTKGEIKFSGKIREVYEKLKGCGFFFSHKSYLVNYRNIESMKNTGITLINGEKIPVSRAHKDDIDEMLLKERKKVRKDEFKL
jgi:DNA-binding LytR/AlgR family response regulator